MNTLYNYKVDRVVQKLINEIGLIPNVQCWIREAKVSRSWLNYAMNKTYGKTPGQILKEIRFEKIILLIENDIEIHSRELAIEVGLINSKNYSDALYKFLSRSYSLNLTKLKKKILNGQQITNHIWLTGSGQKRRQYKKMGDKFYLYA